MKMNRLLSALLAFILLTCLSGVQGQNVVPLSGYSGPMPGATPTFDYSQYYGAVQGSAPAAHVTAPVQYNITSAPQNVYFGIQMQQVPYSTYLPAASGSALWIQGSRDWSQYAVVPQGAMVSLLAISLKEGSGDFVLYDASGQKIDYTYFVYPVSKLSFYADAPGRHTLSYVVNGVASNTVIIDVSGTVTATYSPTGANYYTPLTNNPSDYLGSAYYGNYYPRVSYGPQAALDNANANKEFQKLYGNDAYYYDGGNNNPFAWDYATNMWLNSP
jgi:hypothetical protein